MPDEAPAPISHHKGHHKLVIFSFIAYLMVMTALMIWQGIGIAPDRYAVVLLLGSLLIKRTRSFLLDWIPFLLILISYDFLRGFADTLFEQINYTPLIEADKWMFGGVIPTIWLQQKLFNITALHLYDLAATIIYFLHFALPLGFGFMLWVDNKFRFRQFVVAILLLSYAGWVTYVLFPAAPPWYASEKGFIPGVIKIMDYTLTIFPAALDLPTIYHKINPNHIAAFPSMHAAYPFLILLFAINFFKWKGALFSLYVAALSFSIVYLGEHYVVDVLGGFVYAAVFFVLAKVLTSRVKFLHGEKGQ